MLTSTPTPRPSAATKPQPPQSAYQPYKERSRLAGAISNHGISSVNAVGTPLGRYEKNMYDAVGSNWNFYMQQRGELATLGTARIAFSVDRSGHVKNVKVVSNDSNESFANIALQSILDAKLPPIPGEVADTLPPEGLNELISFTMFPN